MHLPLAALLALTATADAPKQGVANPGYFDVAVCAPAKPTIPQKVDKAVLQGVIQLARPQIFECLVDPKNRGPGKQSKIIVDSTLTDTGVQHKVSGENLTADGTACIQKALDAWTGQFPTINAKDAASKDVASHVELTHAAGVHPAAMFGQNDASDAVAQIRIAESGWCDCFPDAANTIYGAIHGSFKLSKPKSGNEATPTDVAFDPTNDANGDKIAACLKGKVSAVKVKAPASDLQKVPVTFRLTDSNASGKLAGATPDVQFSQYDLEQNQRNALRAIHLGENNNLRIGFSAAATKYNQHAKGAKIDDVASACDALTKSSQGVFDDTQKLVALAKETHDFAAEQKAKDPNWTAIESATAQRIPTFEKQAEDFQKLLDNDKATCSKVTAVEEHPTSKKVVKKGKK